MTLESDWGKTFWDVVEAWFKNQHVFPRPFHVSPSKYCCPSPPEQHVLSPKFVVCSGKHTWPFPVVKLLGTKDGMRAREKMGT